MPTNYTKGANMKHKTDKRVDNMFEIFLDICQKRNSFSIKNSRNIVNIVKLLQFNDSLKDNFTELKYKLNSIPAEKLLALASTQEEKDLLGKYLADLKERNSIKATIKRELSQFKLDLEKSLDAITGETAEDRAKFKSKLETLYTNLFVKTKDKAK